MQEREEIVISSVVLRHFARWCQERARKAVQNIYAASIGPRSYGRWIDLPKERAALLSAVAWMESMGWPKHAGYRDEDWGWLTGKEPYYLCE